MLVRGIQKTVARETSVLEAYVKKSRAQRDLSQIANTLLLVNVLARAKTIQLWKTTKNSHIGFLPISSRKPWEKGCSGQKKTREKQETAIKDFIVRIFLVDLTFLS